MTTTEEILQQLQQRNLVPDPIRQRLRQLYEAAPREFTPRVMMRWLVRAGHLDEALASELLAPPDERTPPPLPAGDDLELSLAPLTEEQGSDEFDLEIDDTDGSTQEIPAVVAPSTDHGSSKAGPAQPMAPVSDTPLNKPGPARKAALDDLFADVPETAPGLPPPLPSIKRKPLLYRRPRGVPAWDSPLLVLGGGGLLLLLLVGSLLWWTLRGESGDQAFAAAEADYDSGSYTQAVQKFEMYLNRFPGHPANSVARVHQGLAQLRLAADNTQDWPAAYATARAVIDRIAAEQAYSAAHAELAVLLPKIAQGLAQQAAADLTPAQIDLAREALRLALNPRIVPTDLQPRSTIAQVEGLLSVAQRALDRQQAFNAAMEAINQAIEDQRLAEVYAAQQQLLGKFPELADDPAFVDLLQQVSRAQQGAVRFVADPRDAEPGDRPATTVAELPIFTTSMPGSVTADKLTMPTLLAFDRGVLYGLDSRQGTLRWRRFVGFDSAVAIGPAGQPQSAVPLAVDSRYNELLRLDADRGSADWRLPLHDELFAPVVCREQIVVAARLGRLYLVDGSSGRSSGYIELPQPIAMAPSTDVRQTLLYQVAEHSNLFTLSLAGGTCRQVTFTGHKTAAIAAPPAVVGRLLLLAENRGVDSALLRVYQTDDEGVPLAELDRIKLEGHVHSIPQVTGRRVWLVTDRGAIYVWDAAPPDTSPPLTPVAAKPPSSDSPGEIPYWHAGDHGLLVADRELTWYDLQASAGRLAPRRLAAAGETAVGPPLALGDGWFTQRRPVFGGMVAELRGGADASVVWRTSLAAPPAALFAHPTDDDGAVLITTRGTVCVIKPGEAANTLGLAAQLDTTPVLPVTAQRFAGDPDGATRVLAPELTPQSRAVDGDLPRKVLVVQLDAAVARARWLLLPEVPAATPTPIGSHLLTPLQLGQVALLDLQRAGEVGLPFQPKVDARLGVAWSQAIADPATGRVFLTDGQSLLYALAIDDRSAVRVDAVAKAALRDPPISTPCLLGETVYLVDQTQHLLAFRAADLVPAGQWRLPVDLEWGPARAGKLALVATRDGHLHAYNDRAQPIWDVPLVHGALASLPFQHGELLFAATTDGTVYQIDAATGESVGLSLALDQPIAAGPVELGGRLLVAGQDGCLLWIQNP